MCASGRLAMFVPAVIILASFSSRSSAQDCNLNGIDDACDISCGDQGGPCDVPGCGLSQDCNSNGIPDECDLLDGTSEDCNLNLVPDECDVTADFQGMSDPASVPLGTTPFWIDSADVDDDLRPDLIAVRSGSPGKLIVLRNLADGSFSRYDWDTTDNLVRVAAGDMNGDAHIDVLTLGTQLAIHLNYQNGMFGSRSYYSVGDSGWGAVLADLDRDQDLDIVVTEARADNLYIFRNDGTGAFPNRTTYRAGRAADVSTADIDRDGDIDIVTSAVEVLLNRGDGTFQDPLAQGTRGNDLLLSDLDGDEYPDLVILDGETDSFKVRRNNHDGTFAAPEDYSVGDYPRQVLGTDIDSDHDIDLFVIVGGSESFSVLRNRGDGVFDSILTLYASGARCAVLTDLDMDADYDLAVSDGRRGAVAIYTNQTTPPASLDCNVNRIPDECDIDSGTSADCNTNLIPDECDIAGGPSPDCNSNDVPDECDIQDGTSRDCNLNGIPDDCISLETDCNGNGTPDECDVLDGTSEDCNMNLVPDECDVADGFSNDCNNNRIPDECDVSCGASCDCNSNLVPDECDIVDGTSQDCNGNLHPDECDIVDGTSTDCDDNTIPDECQGVVDCNGNGILDACDIETGSSSDCNLNGIPDECIAEEGDCNGNNVPDECDVRPPLPFAVGLSFWFRADSIQDLHDGDSVSLWSDDSRNHLDIGQQAPSQRPRYMHGSLGGLPSVRFDGDDLLFRENVLGSLITSQNEATVFFVARQTSSDPLNTLFGWVSSTDRFLVHATVDDQISFQHGDPNNGGKADWSQPQNWDDTMHIVQLWRSGTSAEAIVDGVLLGPRSMTDTPLLGEATTLYLGSDIFSNTFTGDIGELIVYSRALTNDERSDIAEYLEERFLSGPNMQDCNNNGIPDTCTSENDCNTNGLPDECDIYGGTSEDCDSNYIPDECEQDCNGNGIVDECDIRVPEMEFGHEVMFDMLVNEEWAAIDHADLNGDMLDDFIATEEGSSGSSLYVLLNDGTGGTSAPMGFPFGGTGGGRLIIATGDLNGDFRTDIVIPHGTNNGSCQLFINRGVDDAGIWLGLDSTQISSGRREYFTWVDIADFNADSRMDLALIDENGGHAWVFLNDLNGLFSEQRDFAVGSGVPRCLAVGDFDHDQRPDLAVSWHESSSGVSVLINLGNDSSQRWLGFADRVKYNVDLAPGMIIAQDLHGDGWLDLITLHGDHVYVLKNLGLGDGRFGSPRTFGTGGRRCLWIGSEDLDRDGDHDLVFADPGEIDQFPYGARILLNDGLASFGPSELLSTSYRPSWATLSDFNHDGIPDIAAITNYGSPIISLFQNETAPPPTSDDCNGNHVPDECDISGGPSEDCNSNGIPDECDIAEGTSTDRNANGIPDECEADIRVIPIAVTSDPAAGSETRSSEPIGANSITRGQRYWIEVWATDKGGDNTGLTSVYVDAAFCSQTHALALFHGTIFDTFPSGTIVQGGLDEFGGSALPSGGGIEPEWVRVGWIEMRPDNETASCMIELLPSQTGIGAFGRGLIPWEFVELGSLDLEILEPSITYDLDNDGTVGVGDLGVFATSWMQTVPPANAAHDFDCDGFVGPGDLSWFATAWLKDVDDPTIQYPPPCGGPMPDPHRGGPDVAVSLIALTNPSANDLVNTLPDSIGHVNIGDTYFVELWVSDVGDINTGVTSAYLDLLYPSSSSTVIQLVHSDLYNLFASGTVMGDLLDELGGSSLPGNIGIEPQWARVAVIEVLATSENQSAEFLTAPSDAGVACYGRGLIPWSNITLGSVSVQQGGVGVDCGSVDTLKLKCKQSTFKLKAVLLTILPEGTVVHLTRDDVDTREVVIGRRGKGSTKWSNVAQGAHTVCMDECPSICESRSCNP